MISLCALIVAIAAGALAQLSMKAGLLHMETFIPNGLLVFGLSCYAIAMAAWILALKKYDLSFAYPLLSLGYVLVYAGAFYWPGLEETITWNKPIGLSLIVLGVTISAHNNNNGRRIGHDSTRKI